MTDADRDFYRPAAAREVSDPTELERRKELTDEIVANLRVIGADTNDLAALEHRFESIVAARRLVREFSDSLDLERLEVRLASIASALRIIADDATVKELEVQR
jgi:hypothetical protein